MYIDTDCFTHKTCKFQFVNGFSGNGEKKQKEFFRNVPVFKLGSINLSLRTN